MSIGVTHERGEKVWRYSISVRYKYKDELIRLQKLVKKHAIDTNRNAYEVILEALSLFVVAKGLDTK